MEDVFGQLLPGWWGLVWLNLTSAERLRVGPTMGFCCIPGGIGKRGTLDLTLHGRLFDGVELALVFKATYLPS